MRNIDSVWRDMIDDIGRIRTSQYDSISDMCEVLAFYDLAMCFDFHAPDDIEQNIEKIRINAALYKHDFYLDNVTDAKRYFRFINEFDDYIYEELMLLVGQRIDVITMCTYTQSQNYSLYLDSDDKLTNIFRTNREVAEDCRVSLLRNRGIKIGKGVYLPPQYNQVRKMIEKTLSLVF